MTQSSVGKRTTAFELRISVRWVIIGLAILAVVFLVESDRVPDLSLRVQLRGHVLLFCLLLAAAWLLDRWRPMAANCFVIILQSAAIVFSSRLLGQPAVLTLLSLSTVQAAALIGLRAATVVALGVTAPLLWLASTGNAGSAWPSMAAAVTATWGLLALMIAVYVPVYRATSWSWEYYLHAQDLLGEARERTAGMKQTLSDLSHANRQLGLANERLDALRLIAEEAQKTKTAFVAKVSHEFRTPLNMIIGLVDLMVANPEVYEGALPAAVSEDLRIVRRNCEHLSGMVNDVLALSQAEAGRLVLRRERVALGEIIDGALAVVRPLVEKKGLDLEVTIPDDLPMVYCDRTRIRQVILNLASNAARFTQEGRIAIRVAVQGQGAVVSVQDTGPGIPAEDAERIFEPFCQGASKLWRDKSGSGLGLTISKQFVELHGGRIWIESEPGTGTTISFSLPVSPLGHASGPGRWISENWVWVERTSQANLPRPPDKPRVIIHDDTGELCHAYKYHGDEVEFVHALSLAQVAEELRRCPAHAVMLNAQSPDELWPLVSQARQNVRDTPLVGCVVSPEVGRTWRGGVVGYLTKPVTRAELIGAVQNLNGPVRRVLAVDDDPDVLNLWARMLIAHDSTLEIAKASSGQEALDELDTNPPDVMLLDLMMPEMNGWQLLAIKEERQAIRDIPVVLVSAQDPREQLPASQLLLATMDDGLSLSALLRCSLGVSALLLKPDQEPGQGPG